MSNHVIISLPKVHNLLLNIGVSVVHLVYYLLYLLVHYLVYIYNYVMIQQIMLVQVQILLHPVEDLDSYGY